MKFPRGEARALEVGARFRNEDVKFFALLDGDLKNTEGSADASGSERSRVALGHDMAVLRHEFCAEAADGFVGGALFGVDGLGFLNHNGGNFGEVLRARGELFEAGLPPVRCPKIMDRGG